MARLLVPAALAAAVAVAAAGTLLAGCSPSQVSGCADVSLTGPAPDRTAAR